MLHQLLPEIEQFLSSLETTQQEMLQLCQNKTTLLRSGKVLEMTELSQREAFLTRQLQLLLSTRQRLLSMASDVGVPVESLEEIVLQIHTDAAQAVLHRMDKSKKVSDIIRRETWVHWIIAQKSCLHYGELIDIIAHCGNKAPSYAEGLLEDRSGSPLLETSA